MKKLILLLALGACMACERTVEVQPQTLAGTNWVLHYDKPEPWDKKLTFSSDGTVQIRMFLQGEQRSYESYPYLYGAPVLWVDGPFDQNFEGVYYGDSLMLQGEIYKRVKE
ncbi:MAG TPA: hypothetical protein VN038_01405 [Dyadobacter sp.]|nr:hypothetical protein [Dyadobacter sp.]